MPLDGAPVDNGHTGFFSKGMYDLGINLLANLLVAASCSAF